MKLAEMNLLAGCYGITVQRSQELGAFIIDIKTNRYRRICSYEESKKITKERLMQEIRNFTAQIHKRHLTSW